MVNEVDEKRWMTAADRLHNGTNRAHLAKPQRSGDNNNAKRSRTSDSTIATNDSDPDSARMTRRRVSPGTTNIFNNVNPKN